MKPLSRTAWSLVGAALVWGAPAHAEPGPNREEVTVLRTHDGGVVRGKIVEKVPGKYVVLELATGETRRIEWSAIADESDEAGGTRAAPRDPPGDGPGTPAAPATVTFAADSENAQIERSVEGYWVTVCNGPGTCELPADGVYRVNGKGVVTSRPFQLPPGGSRVDAEVGTTGTTAGGAILMAVGGGAALFIGLPLLLAGAVLSSANDGSTTHVDTTGVTTAGAVITIGGAVAGIAGLVMILNNTTTVKTARALPGPRFAGAPGGTPFTGVSPFGFVF